MRCKSQHEAGPFPIIILASEPLGRATLSGGGLIIEFEKVVCVCFGKNFRTQVVSADGDHCHQWLHEPYTASGCVPLPPPPRAIIALSKGDHMHVAVFK